MKGVLNGLGNAAACFGLLLCLTGGLWRVMGNFYFMGFQLISLFSVGISFLLLAILFKVETLIRRG